jgi:peptidyl-prolyl cis-trans isomerase C
VLIATAPGEDAESKQEKQKQAEAVRDKIVATKAENFAEVAAAESDCPSKKDGGNLGLVERGQTVPEFEEAIFSQKVGEVGPVVETPFGYHIVQVQERVPAGVVPLNEVRAAIAQQIDAERKQAAVDKYLSGLRARASIIRPEKEVKEAA